MKKPTLEPERGFSRLRIDLTYDGTNFYGWAKQPNLRTVQQELEDFLSTLAKREVNLTVAGRTDAGVHANNQVVHVDLPDEFIKSDAGQNLKYRCNRVLPTDLRILKVEQISPYFHARFSALSRHYKYQIIDDNQVIPPLQRFQVASWFRKLDLSLMNEAAQLLIGEHDFFAFCKHREGGTTIRQLQKFEWSIKDGVIVCDVIADAFGYSMVRNLVGASVCVGEGRFPPTWMHETLINKVRIPDSYVFPPEGLTLWSVEYPDPSQYQARIEKTFAKRDEDF